ncbi:LacI family DNA-binding transcriptional regulator [Cohnella sp. AR92]|uniref:LacI family DNA-binding transcriptional regulator n=1 Tax=Cohnella sp. AR92 TaxID=648716 RepID=UPI000F8C3714|nr:LacI family DNA-binding transcriptional regulator [Cohnella sp. AR92]RUS46757.1 LacI family transcriptional regulator [Cohnella sp. AR92]
MRKSEISSQEIARLAGVSRSTVSRVINNYSNVPPETREKVMRIIEEHHYVPNMSAQVLAGKRTRTLGLFLVEPEKVGGDSLTNMMLASVIENASQRGYYVLTSIIRDTEDQDGVRGVKDIFYQRRIDGGIFIGSAKEEPFLEQLIDEGYIVGLFDQRLRGRSETNRIVANFDNDEGMRLAVEYLLSLNHRKIGVVTGDLNRLSGVTKQEGFLAAMRKSGLPVNEEWVIPGGFHESNGYEAMQAFLRSGKPLPSAIIMANDSVAFGAIRAIRERGLEVPGDLSVIGFDDHERSSSFEPPLTTFKVDFGIMMKRLTEAVLERIENEETESYEFTAGYELIARDSCRKL